MASILQAPADRVRDFDYFLAAGAAKNYEKMAVIQSAASAASMQGGCTSSRLDHGLKFYVNRGGCASSRLINRFSDCNACCYTQSCSISIWACGCSRFVAHHGLAVYQLKFLKYASDFFKSHQKWKSWILLARAWDAKSDTGCLACP